MRKITTFVGLLFVLLLLTATAAPAAFAQGIAGDEVVLGENYVLREGETLDGNLAVLGGTAQIDNGATVRGDVSVLGGSLDLNGRVTGNVSLLGGSARLNDGSVIEGNLANLAGSVQQAPGAVVRGDTFNGFSTPGRINPAPVVPDFSGQRETPRSWFERFFGWQLGTIGSILLMGLLGLVLVLVAPRAVGRVASGSAEQPGTTFIVGLLTLILGLLAGLVLLIACGLGLLIWLALAAASVLGWVGVSLWLGQRLLRGLNVRNPSSIVEVLVGVVLITFLSRLPCIGWLVWLIFVSWGLGAVVLTRFGTQDALAPRRSGPLPPALDAGSGGGFAPLPPSSDVDLAAPVVAPRTPDEPPVVAAPESAVETITQVEPTPVDDMGVAVTPEQAAAAALLTDINGIDAALADRLQAAGVHAVADIARSTPDELAIVTGVAAERIAAEDWIGQAQRLA